MKDKKKFNIFIIAIVIAISSVFIYKGAIAPKLYDKYLNQGIQYLMDEKYEEAILAFDKAIKIEPKTTEARVYQAKAYVGNEEFDKAVDVLEEAQQIDMTNEELLKEILDILKEIDMNIAYEFIEKYIDEVGEDNISEEIKELLDSVKEGLSESITASEQMLIGKFIMYSDGGVKKFGSNAVVSGNLGSSIAGWLYESSSIDGNTITYKCKVTGEYGEFYGYDDVIIEFLDENTISMKYGKDSPYETFTLLSREEFANAGGVLSSWE